MLKAEWRKGNQESVIWPNRPANLPAADCTEWRSVMAHHAIELWSVGTAVIRSRSLEQSYRASRHSTALWITDCTVSVRCRRDGGGRIDKIPPFEPRTISLNCYIRFSRLKTDSNKTRPVIMIVFQTTALQILVFVRKAKEGMSHLMDGYVFPARLDTGLCYRASHSTVDLSVRPETLRVI
jgi:hypothetical protein